MLGLFSPANIQRDYIWDAQQSEDLLNDIEKACSIDGDSDADHAVGSRVSVADSVDDDALGEHEIVAQHIEPPSEKAGYHLGGVVLLPVGGGAFHIFDGLQRTTTLTILLCLIRDLTTSEALRRRISAVIKQGDAFRVTLPGLDRTLQKEIQPDGFATRGFRKSVGARGERIRRSRNLFHSYIRTWGQEHLSRVGCFVLERTYLVVCETNSKSLATQVFVTANKRGLNLSEVDIFKGQLLAIAEVDGIEDGIAARWEGIRQIVDKEIGDFMQAYDFIKRREVQEPDYLSKLADYIETFHGPSRLPEVLDDILSFASSWVEMRAKLRSPPSTALDLEIWKLNAFKWFEWKPLALAWFKDFREKRASPKNRSAMPLFDKRMSTLHRACMVMTLAKFTALQRANIFRRAISQWRHGSDPYSAKSQSGGALTFTPRTILRAKETLRLPLNEDETRISLLRWIEACLNSPESLDPGLLSATVEHVLPQRPEPNSQWLKDFPEEEDRFASCHSLGNLAVMDYQPNYEIGNKDFALKLPVIAEQAKKYRTLADIAIQTDWTAAKIASRAEHLFALACGKLNIPTDT